MEENNEQYLLELRQRIIAKAEEMAKINYSGGRKASKTTRWIFIAVLVALFVWIEVFLYNKNDFWVTNAWMGVFIIVSFIGAYLMKLIMRHFLSTMKNATSDSQFYRAVKRLILTHKLQYLISLALGWAAGGVVAYRLGSAYYWSSIPAATACFIGTIIGAAMRNWYLDEDFRYDVEELGDLIKQDSAA